MAVDEAAVLRIRPDRTVMGFGGVVMVAIAFFLVWRGLGSGGASPFWWAFDIALVSLVVFTFVHYLWFYFIEVGDDVVRQVRYFGMGNRTIAIRCQ